MGSPTSYQTVSIDYDGHNGIRFLAQTPVYTHKEITRTEAFLELELLEDARSRLQPGDLVVDIGAHVGNHSLFFALLCACDVVAVEPDASNFDSLRATLEANDPNGRVTLHNIAIGAKPGRGRFTNHGTASASTLKIASDANGDIEIQTIDAILDPEENVSILKIDIEGAEADALRGASRTLQTWRPRIYAECLNIDEFDAVDAILRPMGYDVAGCFCASPTFAFAFSDSQRGGSKARRYAKAAIAERDARKARLRHLIDENGRLRNRIQDLREDLKAASHAPTP